MRITRVIRKNDEESLRESRSERINMRLEELREAKRAKNKNSKVAGGKRAFGEMTDDAKGYRKAENMKSFKDEANTGGFKDMGKIKKVTDKDAPKGSASLIEARKAIRRRILERKIQRLREARLEALKNHRVNLNENIEDDDVDEDIDTIRESRLDAIRRRREMNERRERLETIRERRKAKKDEDEDVDECKECDQPNKEARIREVRKRLREARLQLIRQKLQERTKKVDDDEDMVVETKEPVKPVEETKETVKPVVEAKTEKKEVIKESASYLARKNRLKKYLEDKM